jgi:hypothetical protein
LHFNFNFIWLRIKVHKFQFLKSEHPETYLAVLAQAKAKLKETANGNDKGAT